MGEIIKFPGQQPEQKQETFLEAVVRTARQINLGDLRKLAERQPPTGMEGLYRAILNERMANGETEKKRDLAAILQGRES